ncbi:hypothetical protein [Rubripirellula reticaptiva]|uniref:hypothetical protein n=1 Tax=Rubripirellula reticaptiva TaxID=2528013 RepID=UPI0011B57A72|nr:hypothetical protein [Rubripirellula reticaptiva]
MRSKTQRTRILPLNDNVIIYVLPDETELSGVRYEQTDHSDLNVTDGKNFTLDLSELGHPKPSTERSFEAEGL